MSEEQTQNINALLSLASSLARESKSYRRHVDDINFTFQVTHIQTHTCIDGIPNDSHHRLSLAYNNNISLGSML